MVLQSARKPPLPVACTSRFSFIKYSLREVLHSLTICDIGNLVQGGDVTAVFHFSNASPLFFLFRLEVSSKYLLFCFDFRPVDSHLMRCRDA